MKAEFKYSGIAGVVFPVSGTGKYVLNDKEKKLNHAGSFIQHFTTAEILFQNRQYRRDTSARFQRRLCVFQTKKRNQQRRI